MFISNFRMSQPDLDVGAAPSLDILLQEKQRRYFTLPRGFLSISNYIP